MQQPTAGRQAGIRLVIALFSMPVIYEGSKIRITLLYKLHCSVYSYFQVLHEFKTYGLILNFFD